MKWLNVDEADQSMSYKFYGLSQLKRHGIKIPGTYGLAADTITRDGVRQQKPMIERFLAERLATGKMYCVRSAKGEEDGMTSSKAGQFTTVLNVTTNEQVYRAIEAVAASYDKVGAPTGSKQDVIMIQEMVSPVYSGVLFSKNPVNGANEVLLEAVEGLGEQLVQRGVAPVRVKYKWKQLLYDSERKLPIPATEIAKFCREAARFEQRVATPIDVEWAYDGKEFIWLQVRPITTHGTFNVYKNDIAKNYLPGLIKPLVWDINIPVVNEAWIDLLESIIGDTGIQANELAKAFYYQAYFNMGILGGAFRKMGFSEQFLEELQGIHDERIAVKFRPTLGMARLVPRMIGLYRRLMRTYRQLDTLLEAYHRRTIELEAAIGEASSFGQLLTLLDKVKFHNQEGAKLNIALPLMIYSKQRRYLNSIKNQQTSLPPSLYLRENALYEPDSFLKCETSLSGDEKRTMLLHRFGHFSTNTNDFSQPTWREQQQILDALVSASLEDDATTGASDWQGNKKFLRLKKKADLATHKKNKLSYYYAYSYHLFRLLFLKLANIMVEHQAIATVDDIFYLNIEDVLQFDGGSYRDKVATVRAEMEQAKDYRLPAVIKGDEPPIVVPEAQVQQRFVGYPASTGRVQGIAQVVKELEDFAKVNLGDIVVVENAEMGYFPLLRLAGAIVVETGAMLSHIAILARERQIPCIMSAKNIMQIADGTRLVVDAYKGEILVLDGETCDTA